MDANAIIAERITPHVEETFGELVFAGKVNDVTRRVNRRDFIASRTYLLYSSELPTEQVTVTLPGGVAEKSLDFEAPIQLVGPWIEIERVTAGTSSRANYELHADDIIIAE